MPISQRLPIPRDEDQFERMSLELLRRYWSRPGLELFGKRGERQYGIDILDLSGDTPVYAAQCKLKEEHKSLPPSEIQHEVDEAKKFSTPLGKFAILTTAKISAQAQTAIRDINQAHKAQGLFEVELLAWDQICPLLQDYSDVQEKFYGPIESETAKRIQTHLMAINGGIQSLTSLVVGSDADIRINEARDCINNREFQLATLLLNLIHRSGIDLTPRQRYRVLANHGAAALGQGKPAEAAKFFLEALSCQPDDEQARTNEALAYLLVNDIATCYEKAELLRLRYPANTRIAALWVSSAPQNMLLVELEQNLNPVLQSDAEVAVALSRRAIAEVDFDKALTHANAAIVAAPRWAQTHLALAEIKVAKALRLDFDLHAKNENQEELLKEARDGCSLAIEISRAEKDRNSEVLALVHRVDVNLLLKDLHASRRDGDDAHRLEPDDANVLAARARIHLAASEVDEGISLLKRSYDLDSRSDVALNLGKALFARGNAGDLEDAINVLRKIPLADFRNEFRPTVVTLLIQCFSTKRDWGEATRYLAQVSSWLDAAVVKVVEGYLAFYQDLNDQANQHASEAHNLISAGATPDTKEFLARLLMLLGRRSEALPLWKDLFELDRPGFDPGHLLDCAARLQRDDMILEACNRLRSRGINDWRLIEFELPYLQKYNVDGAIELLSAFVRTNPDHKLARLRLSLIGLLLNKRELVRATEDDIPAVDDLPPEWAVSAVQVLKLGGDPDRAVDYAYRYLRMNFSEIAR